MKSRHLFEENIYLIQNFCVARNQLFREESDRLIFLKTLDAYLNPICEILEYALYQGHYSIIVKLKSRLDFLRYFKKRHNGAIINKDFVPESSYIFSQAMANFQVSYVKYYNFKYKRKGGLFAQRFRRELVDNGAEFDFYRTMMQRLKCKGLNSGEWISEEDSNEELVLYLKGSCVEGNKQGKNPIVHVAAYDAINELRGHFINTPKIDLIPLLHRHHIKIFHRKHPCWPNCN